MAIVTDNTSENVSLLLRLVNVCTALWKELDIIMWPLPVYLFTFVGIRMLSASKLE